MNNNAQSQISPNVVQKQKDIIIKTNTNDVFKNFLF